MTMTSRLCIVGVLIAASCPSAFAGQRLDDLLNVPFLDAQSPKRDETRHADIEPDAPLGQTFLTGPEVQRVYEVAIWQAFWHESWQPDESLVMTLWDSPEKRVSLGRCGIPYARRMWEQAVPIFHLDARVEPKKTYYFELTVDTEPLRPAQVPREWILSGIRPGFAGGDGRLVGIGVAREDYPDGSAYVGGQPRDFDLWFALHARRAPDREALYTEAFGRFDLDYPKLRRVRAAVRKRDWDAAVEALVAYFEGRADLIEPDRERPRFDPTFDTREADLAVEHKVLLPDGTSVDLGPQWNHFVQWPERGGVGLTRSGLRKPLAAAYLHTSNEKYARAFDDMLAHQFLEHPSPIRAGVYSLQDEIPAALPTGLAGGSFWSGLSIGARMAHGFAYYKRFVDSPYFTRDVRAAFIINLGEMAEVLERMKGGGNWETQMADALFDFGLTYPEFKGARSWVQQGLDTLIQNARETVRPDGCLQEPTTNYHLLVMGRYLNVIRRTRELKLPLPEDVVKITEKMHEYVMYSALPDGSLPLWGDSNPPTTAQAIADGANLFGRDDFRYVASNGQEGRPPAATSIGFPDGGFYYMRTGWDPNAHYMAVRCGPHGSHGHQDALSIIVAAFGRQLLIDPGVYTYGTPESTELAQTRSHNTVAVDDADASSAKADRWVTSQRFDLFAGQNSGYRGLAGIRHHRRIWFLKPFDHHPGFWVLLDDVVGQGEHTTSLRYRFAPVPVVSDPALLAVCTKTTPGLTVIAAPAQKALLSVSDGIAADSWGSLARVPVATYEQRRSLPSEFTSLLVPYTASAPAVHVATLPVSPSALGARAIWATVDNEAVAIVGGPLDVFAAEPMALATTLPDGRRLSVVARALAVRLIKKGDVWAPYAVLGEQVQSAMLGEESLLNGPAVGDVLDRVIP